MFARFLCDFLWAAIQAVPEDRWRAIDSDVRVGVCMLLQPSRY